MILWFTEFALSPDDVSSELLKSSLFFSVIIIDDPYMRDLGPDNPTPYLALDLPGLA